VNYSLYKVRFKYITAITLLFFLAQSVFCALPLSGQSWSSSIDAAPLLKLLQDTLMAVISGEYDTALTMCKFALNISLPSEVSYIHTKLYFKLNDTINLLIRTENLLSNETINAGAYGDYILHTIYDLYLTKIDLTEIMNNYVNELARFIPDQGTRYYMASSFEEYVINLQIRFDYFLSKLTQLYLGNMYGGEIHIHLSHPETISGGENYQINVTTTSSTSLKYVNLTLIIIYSDVIIDRFSINGSLNKTITVNTRAPSAEKIASIINLGLNPSLINSAKIIAVAGSNVGNTTLTGYALSNMTLIYVTPTVNFTAPDHIYPSQSIDIKIKASLDYPLNIKLYLDKVSNSNMLLNTSIRSGENVFSLKPLNLSQGLHKIILVTEPKGKYLPLTYTHIIELKLREIYVAAGVEALALVPLRKPSVNLYVDSNTSYDVNIYVENSKTNTYRGLTSKFEYTLPIDIPFTLLMWRYRVVVEVKPHDPNYVTRRVESYISVINIPILAVLTCFLVIAFTTPTKTRYVIHSLVSIVNTVKYRLVRARGRKNKSELLAKPAKYYFRTPRSIHLYRRLIAVISKYINPPGKSETLREFYRRVDRTINESMKKLVKGFLDIYEKDLYSNHDVNTSEAEKYLDELMKIESK